MTPKEEAQSLIKQITYGDMYIKIKIASMMVDKILEVLYEVDESGNVTDYYREVKQELEKP